MRSIFFIAFLIFTNTVFSQAVNGVKTVNGVAANSSGEITISGGSGITLPQLTDSLNVIRGNKLSNITGLVTAGTGATVTGSGTSGSPYVIGASGGGSVSTDSIYPVIWQRKGTAVDSMYSYQQGNIYENTTLRDTGAMLLAVPKTDTVFKMWFTSGWDPGSNGIGYAESPTGYPGTWTVKNGFVLPNVLRSSVFKKGNTYYLFGTTGNPSTVLAKYTSYNGVTWSMNKDSVLTKAAFAGAIRIDNSYVLDEGATWSMWIDVGSASSTYSIAYLSSSDSGKTWTQPFTNPVITGLGAGGPFVHKEGSTYYLYCHGTGNQLTNLPSDGLVYKSTDKNNYTLSPNYFFARRRGIDEGENNNVGQFADLCLLTVKDSVYLYYSASKDGSAKTGNQHIKLMVAKMGWAALEASTQNDLSYKTNDLAIGNEVVHALPGVIPFVGASSLLSSDSSFSYDYSKRLLGLGIAVPKNKLDIFGNSATPLILKIKNANTGNTNAALSIENSTNSASISKNSTGYVTFKNLSANDFGFYNAFGNMSFLQDNAASNINFQVFNTPVLTLTPTAVQPNVSIQIPSMAAPIVINRSLSSGLSRINFKTGATTEWYIGYRGNNNNADFSFTSSVGSLWLYNTTGNIRIDPAFDVVDNGEKLQVAGNINLTTAGNKLKIATGTNASVGTATLTAGTVTVSTTAALTASLIYVSVKTAAGTQGFLSVPTIVNATSFTINSSSATETSTVNWWIIN